MSLAPDHVAEVASNEPVQQHSRTPLPEKMHRPRHGVMAENAKFARLFSNAPGEVEDKLIKPFKCPRAAAPTREYAQPPRKRRKVNYAEIGDGTNLNEDGTHAAVDNREPLATRDANKFPVFEVKDKDVVFRKKFSVPLINKYAEHASRPAPALGMRIRANFVPKPLHDPSGEFAIVLYDPTVDDKSVEEQAKEEEAPKPVSKVHKSLADILGLKRQKEEHPKVAVVIDPKLAKVLRPHQIEGVKFLYRCTTGLIDPRANGCIMADEMGLGKTVRNLNLVG